VTREPRLTRPVEEARLRPLVFTWPLGIVYWIACAWSLRAELQLDYRTTGATQRDPQDEGSRFVVVGVVLTLAALAVAASLAVPRLAIADLRLGVFWAGTALTIAGGLLRRHCMRMLGPLFTPRIQVTPGQPIVQRGAYRWVRHPSYTAGFLTYTGLGLALGNWASLILLAGGTALIYVYRAAVEERALLGALGREYAEYRARTRRFVPFLF